MGEWRAYEVIEISKPKALLENSRSSSRNGEWWGFVIGGGLSIVCNVSTTDCTSRLDDMQ